MCSSKAGSNGHGPGPGGQRPGRRPDVADIRGYAASLGLDAALDQDLLWLAREALCQPLPGSWREHVDEQGRTYFFKESTKESSWLHPADTVFRELVGVIKAVRLQQPRAPESCRVVAVEEHMLTIHQRAERELQAWSGPYEAQGGEYYYNETLDVSSWSNPAEEWQVELDLRHRVLQRCLLDEWCVAGARAPSEDSFRTGHSSRASSPALSCRSGRSGRSATPTPPAPRCGAEVAGSGKGTRLTLPEAVAAARGAGAECTPLQSRSPTTDGGDSRSTDIEAEIAAFARDPSRNSLELPPGMSPAQRKRAKELAAQHDGLVCEAYGFGAERRLHLFRESPTAKSDADASAVTVCEETENEQDITFGPSQSQQFPTWRFETAAAAQ